MIKMFKKFLEMIDKDVEKSVCEDLKMKGLSQKEIDMLLKSEEPKQIKK